MQCKDSIMRKGKRKSTISVNALKSGVRYHLQKTQGLGLKGVLSIRDAVRQRLYLHIYRAIALTLRDKIMDNWIATFQEYRRRDVKRLYYISAEYLTGRFLGNNLMNLNAEGDVQEFLVSVGSGLNDLEDCEMDAGLGSGGLGRLAACYLDSMAAMQLPGYGYGLRYDYGIFQQELLDGYQVERPDQWLQHGNPWEIRREEESVVIKFGGRIDREGTLDGKGRTRVDGCEPVVAVPFDTPIVGYKNNTVNTLRLWSTSVPDYDKFNIEAFDRGDYETALRDVMSHDGLTMAAVLYPNDNHDSGRRLRLKQQYVLVSASMQDIFAKYKRKHRSFNRFHEKVAVQINDTHPALAITELMRIFVDEEAVGWNKAWDITVKTCGYTNHTVMKEALEQWDTDMMKDIVPRNYEIIEIINHDFCKLVFDKCAGDMDRIRRMSVIENGKVRMAHLAVVGSHSVNGVAALHTEILQNDIFRDFYDLFPERFNNKTNGVTQRRWLLKANPELSCLITEKIGDGWITDLRRLRDLEAYKDDVQFLGRIMDVKRSNKERLVEYIHRHNPVKDKGGRIIERVEIDVNSIFDVQAKRLHEYKRQLMNALHILMLYNELKDNPERSIVPRTFIFAAKSAPGYERAKAIIKFINVLATLINNDPEINGLIKVVFMENYNASMAELLLTAADVSEQISTAGLEASGTGNMKLALNGALTIGTMDGANIEMSEEIGAENMFIFGMSADEVHGLKRQGYCPSDICNSVSAIGRVVEQLRRGELTSIPEEMEILHAIAESLITEDTFCVLKDILSYKEEQERVAELYNNRIAWARMVVLNIAGMGMFSSDRAVMAYNDDIWHLEQIPVV